MAKKKPKIFDREGETALAYTPADEVRLVYNGWSERKPAPEQPPPADATADEGSTTTKATKAGGRKAD